MRLFSFLVVLSLITVTSPAMAKGYNSRESQSLYSIKDTLTKDTLIRFNASPDQGFNFDYFVYLPKGLRLGQHTYLLVETTNTGANDSMEYHEKGARHAASKSSVGNYVARKLRLPLLVPVFPRSAINWMYYTHALDRETLLSKDFGIERLDLQLLAMIADARRNLAPQQLFLQDKFFITGFSASGTFANRFSLLHPEKIKATASGGINAMVILPVTKLNDKNLNYPLGMRDVKKITGKRVHLKAFKALPKLFYMGEKDENDAVAFDDAYSVEERTLVYSLMGKQMIPDRWGFMRQVYQREQVQGEFKTYQNIGHGTDLRINNELVDFFRKYLD